MSSDTYLVSLFTAWHGASKRLLVSSVHAHRAEDGLRADGALCGPWLITVRLLKVHLLLITLATWEMVKDRKSHMYWIRSSDLCTLHHNHNLWWWNPGLRASRLTNVDRSHHVLWASVPIMCTLCVTAPKFPERLKYANRGKEFMHFIEVLGSVNSFID